MEIIVDCPKCGVSEVVPRSKWVKEGHVYIFIGECKGCDTLCRAELIPFEASIKLFVVETNSIDESERISM